MSDRDQTVLIVDDDPGIVKILGLHLRRAGYRIASAESGEEALRVLEHRNVDLMFSDLRMPGMGGMTLLRRVAEARPNLPVVMLTAHGTVETAVEAMKLGAVEFMAKPFESDDIVELVEDALRAKGGQPELPPEPPRHGMSDFVGESDAMREVFDLIDRAATTRATVLIRGETGTGKELIARAIHDRGPNSSERFMKVHCAGLPEDLLESELFGYEPGAFTGAKDKRKPGRIELADGGTVFLDEIGDVSVTTQIKLLRVLQDREYELLGGTQTLHADVRFIAATHRDLAAMTETGEFREDFFYRLNVIPIWVPPLRERRDDIPRLADYFCSKYAEANGRDAALNREAVHRLSVEDWPGNVRQLQNLVERLVVLSDDEVIDADDVERELRRSVGRQMVAGAELDEGESEPDSDSAAETQTLEQRRKEAEREWIREILKRCRGNKSQAARILGVSRKTIYNKIEEYGLE